MPKVEGCPFCPENIQARVPLFSEDILPDGRLSKGECLLFPNMFPFAEHHAVATLTKQHFVGIGGFQPRSVADNLSCVLQYVEVVHRRDRRARYPIYIWNHLPPSAASIVHPHTQAIVDRRPTPYQRRLLAASRAYHRRHGRSFWQDLAIEERHRGERYIGENRSLWAVASYAPQGNREVQLIFKKGSSLDGLEEEQVGDFADALARVLRGYAGMGVDSFNLSTFSGPLGVELPYYSLHARVISRPVLRAYYRNDTGPLERLHHEADIEVAPEAVAQALRPFFGPSIPS
ncbi:MAG: hypothetical protein AB1603_05615 [Chloroflexota bacterium]